MDEPMIPGGFEKRPPRTVPPRPTVRESAVTLIVPEPRVVDRGRLEHEREGGGAPSQRKVKRP
jgi:hypothetical protein